MHICWEGLCRATRKSYCFHVASVDLAFSRSIKQFHAIENQTGEIWSYCSCLCGDVDRQYCSIGHCHAFSQLSQLHDFWLHARIFPVRSQKMIVPKAPSATKIHRYFVSIFGDLYSYPTWINRPRTDWPR